MIVGHVGPPMQRGGGPAGYLYELFRAAPPALPSRHQVLFPPLAGIPQTPSMAERARQRLREWASGWRRFLLGPPVFYRPARSDLEQRGGVVDAHLRRVREAAVATARESMAAALARADVVFAHDPFCAEHALARRGPGQKVWLLIHSPMPVGLYQAWCWGVPELPWQEVLALPDVRAWIQWELDIWQQVDALVIPCREAAEDFGHFDRRLPAALSRAVHLLSGAGSALRPEAPEVRDAVRRQWRLPRGARVGLFLGNAHPYRGLDVLLAALRELPERSDAGIVAVAGPPRTAIPRHPRLRALGHVDDVGSLLRAVDFVVSLNRFALFDLSAIEALQAGKPLLLHGVGGNRTLIGLGAGCHVVDRLEPTCVARGLRAMFGAPGEQLAAMGRASRACYEAHLTPEKVWGRHLALYDALDAVADSRQAGSA